MFCLVLPVVATLKKTDSDRVVLATAAAITEPLGNLTVEEVVCYHFQLINL